MFKLKIDFPDYLIDFPPFYPWYTATTLFVQIRLREPHKGET